MKHKFLKRDEFIEVRYASFLKKKAFVQEHFIEDLIHMTDLDKDYGDGIMKNIVICDQCNENIVVLFSKLFVDEIVKALDKKGLHLKDFYKVVGIAPSTIYRWRHYEDVPNLLTYFKICHMLELDCVALLKKARL